MAEPAVPADPVILLGRGGSGTRMLAQLGRAGGVFIGNAVSASGDSLEWVETIYRLALESVTAGVPAGSARDAYWRGRLLYQAAVVLHAARLASAAPWGWKLPETMLALPQVLRTFPGARVVHLVRHPLTSALRRTHLTSRTDNPIGQAALPAAYRAAGLDPASLAHDEEYVHNALSWRFQVGAALDALARMVPAARVLQLRYEDVCADPGRAADQLAAFVGRTVDRSHLPAIDPGRTNQPADDERAERVWAICATTAARLGYVRR